MGFLWLLQFPPIDHKQVYGSFPVTAGMDTSTPVNLVKNKQHQSISNSKKKIALPVWTRCASTVSKSSF